MIGRFLKHSCKYKSCAVILSGCGYGDGSEIVESVSSMISLWKNDVDISFFSLDKTQHHVLNHVSFEEIDGERNCILESTRISRDPVNDLQTLDVEEFDMLVIPGGFGVAKNLCDFAFSGAEFEIEDIVEKTILEFHKQEKPIGAVCISPILIAKLLGDEGVKITLGDSDEGINSIGESFGAVVEVVGNDGVVVCEKNKVVTTPAYMSSDANPSACFDGISKMISHMVDLC